MKALWGWLDAPIGDRPAKGVLAAMGAGEGRHLAHANAALAASGDSAEADLASENGICAVMLGRPRWTDEGLAATARARGHGTALLAAYGKQGEDLLGRLRGGFALAVVDAPRQRLLLAIDRFGIESLSWSTPRQGGIVFGSSTRQVRGHPAVTSTIPEQAIFNYLYFGISPSPGTVYREQSKLLPAQYLVFSRGAARTGFYWQMPYQERSEDSVADLSAELMALMRGAVRRAIEGEEREALGAFLSGGLDSSTVTGLLSEATGRGTKSFSIGFGHDRYDETRYAEIAARHFGTEQHSYYVTPQDVAKLLVGVAQAFDEPFGNSSVVPTYYCAKLAREHGVRLLLAGDGGDEIFAGNSRYVDQQIFGLYQLIPGFVRQRMIEPLSRAMPFLDRLPLGRKARSYINRARIAMPERLESYNFYRNNPLDEIFTPDTLAAISVEAPLENLREAYDRTRSSSMLQQMLHLDLKITLADNDLRKVGGACAMAGMRVAYPFLDEDVVEFSARVPPSLLIRRLERRWFFKQAVRDFLAPETLAKRKHGFGMPFAEWPRQDPELRAIAVDCIEGMKRRGYLRPSFLDRVIAGDEDGVYSGLVWDIIMLELWFREHRGTALATTPALEQPLLASGS